VLIRGRENEVQSNILTTENSVHLDLTQAITQRAGFLEPSRGGFLTLPHGLVHPEGSSSYCARIRSSLKKVREVLDSKDQREAEKLDENQRPNVSINVLTWPAID